MEELSISASADFINDGGLQVDKDGAGDVLSSTSLREEGVEGIVTTTDGLIRGHLAIGLDATERKPERDGAEGDQWSVKVR